MFLPLPGYDALGRKVLVYRIGCFPPDKVKLEDLERGFGMVNEVLSYEGLSVQLIIRFYIKSITK